MPSLAVYLGDDVGGELCILLGGREVDCQIILRRTYSHPKTSREKKPPSFNNFAATKSNQSKNNPKSQKEKGIKDQRIEWGKKG